GEISRPRRQGARAGSQGTARALHPARGRSPQRRAVHRPHLQAQARPGDQEILKGCKARCGGLMALRLVFMGTPDFAVPTLAEIGGRGHDVAAVSTREAKPAGRRGLNLQPTPVEREARRFGLEVLTPKSLRTPEAQDVFRAHKADAAVVVAYGL